MSTTTATTDERPNTPVRTEVSSTDSKHLLSPASATAVIPPSTKKQRTMSTTTSPATNPTGLPALQIKLLSPAGRAPTRGSEFAAGYDVYAARDTTVPARGKVLVDTDIAIAVPAGCYGRIAPRSGLASKNFIDTGAGVIDADVRVPPPPPPALCPARMNG